MKIRIGVLSTADIAERRMIPAIKKIADFEFMGVAIASKEEWGNITQAKFDELNEVNLQRANLFVEEFGGKVYKSFSSLLEDQTIDAIYVPLPPALHKKWIIKGLENNKHIIAEKPITCSYEDTFEIINLAKEKKLNIIENYGFEYHNQLIKIKELINENTIGKMKNIKSTFCFPHRAQSDFRYNKELGGGALLDCGGYTIKGVTIFLGSNTKIVDSNLIITKNHEVDIYGKASLINDKNISAEIFFGMDNDYKCELFIKGEKGVISTSRAFTAPDNLDITIRLNNEDILIEKDDQFMKLLLVFNKMIIDETISNKIKNDILLQSKLVDTIANGNIIDEN